MPADTNVQNPVLERLRELEVRLSALNSGSPSDVQPIREIVARHELHREKVYGEVLRSATSFARDVSGTIDQKVAARLGRIADRAVSLLTTEAPRIELSHAERMLDAQESQIGALGERFAEVRKSAANIEERLAGAGETLDGVWKHQDATEIGAWRMVMRSVSAELSTQVESKKKSEPSLQDRYRGDPMGNSKIPVPAANLVCSRCKQAALRRVARVSLFEELLRMAFLSPYRCGRCGEHSYHFR